MIRALRRIISIRNLKAKKPQGQVATILMLVIVAILIFIVTTVNIGKLSLSATNISNAADAAALSLGSQLGSRANSLMYSLQDEEDKENMSSWETKKCTKGGLLGVFAAIGLAIAGFFTGGATWAILLGMLGGAVGKGIATGSWSGALQGGIMGACIGAGVAAMGAAIAGGVTTGLPSTSITGFTTLPGAALPMASISATTTIAASSLALAVAGAAGSIYGEVAAASAKMDQIDAILKQINNIKDEYLRLQESIFFDVLSKTVDDPERVRDAVDFDGDGDSQEMVSRFLYKYYTEHLSKFKFTSSTDAIKKFQQTLNSYTSHDSPIREFLRWISRSEVECSSCDCAHPDFNCSEGAMIELLRAFKNCGLNPSFWEPGPDKSTLEAWYQCDTCTTPPAGYDEVDAVRKKLEDFIDVAKAIIDKDPADLDRDQSWVDVFYLRPRHDRRPPGEEPVPEGERADFYYKFKQIAGTDLSPFDEAKIHQDLELKGMIGKWESKMYELHDVDRCQIAYGNYSPHVIRQENDQPCGKPYAPDYYSLSDQEKANFSPFYPCVWKRYDGDNGESEGVYIPDYYCRSNINHGDNVLTPELNAIEDIANNLPEILKEKYKDKLIGACNSSTDGCAGKGCDWEALKDTIKVHITSLSLTNAGKRGPCEAARRRNEQNSQLNPVFYFTYKCSDCLEADCRRYPVGTGTLPQDGKEGIVVEDVADMYGYVRYIVDIPQVSGDDTEATLASFLEITQKIRDAIPSIKGGPGFRFGTLDADLNSEFAPVMQNLFDWRQDLVRLTQAIKQFYDDLQEKAVARRTNGAGTLYYEWDDSQGAHKVTVETGPFILAESKQTESGNFLMNKTCTEVINYCENTFDCPYNRASDWAWVKIAREDPAGTSVSSKKNILGIWNPYDTGGGKLTVIRESVASYSYSKVGIARRKIRR